MCRFSSSLTHAEALAEHPVFPVDNSSSALSVGTEHGLLPTVMKAFSIGTVPSGLPAEATPWRATPLSESIKAQLPRADWPHCLAKGGRMLLSLPELRMFYYGPASAHLCINLIRSIQVQEGRGGRQQEEKLQEGWSKNHWCLLRQDWLSQQ